MEGIYNLKRRLRRLEQQLTSLVLVVSGLGSTQKGSGAPIEGATGTFYYDTVGRNLYYNEGDNTTPSWVIIG